MVQLRRVKGAGSARPESAPTLRWLGPGPWSPGSGGVRAGGGTWCCGWVLAPFAVDQAADLCSCGHENDDSAAGLVCMSWTAPGTRTTATWNA